MYQLFLVRGLGEIQVTLRIYSLSLSSFDYGSVVKNHHFPTSSEIFQCSRVMDAHIGLMCSWVSTVQQLLASLLLFCCIECPSIPPGLPLRLYSKRKHSLKTDLAPQNCNKNWIFYQTFQEEIRNRVCMVFAIVKN